LQGLSFPEFEVGAILDDRFEVLRLLGKGGMGVVLEVKHLGLRQRVALKLLRPDVAPSVAARFVREAHAAARLKSEHVVRIMDVGKLSSGVPFIVMERLEGTDLARRLLAKRRLDFEEVLDYLFQTLEALAEAHQLGVIHRDLKPANLFVAKTTGTSHAIKVLDFGISKLSQLDTTTQDELTAAKTVLGSPLYMSPEQLRDARSVEPSSDIWSLGVIAYEMLTGRLPFQALTFPDLVNAVVRGSFAPLAEQCPHLPLELGHVIERCLEKDPERRFSSAKALTVALAPWANTPERMVSIERIVHVRSSRPPKPSDSTPPPARSSEPPLPASPKRHLHSDEREPVPRAPLFAAGILLLAVCALAWLATRKVELQPERGTASATPSRAPLAVALPASSMEPPPSPVSSPAVPAPAQPAAAASAEVAPAVAPPPAAIVPKARTKKRVSARVTQSSTRRSPTEAGSGRTAPPLSASAPLPARPLDEGNPFRR
jgi:eukaryotic-like serine/threonine-protein kinase